MSDDRSYERSPRYAPVRVKRDDLINLSAGELSEILAGEKAYNASLPSGESAAKFIASLDAAQLRLFADALRDRLLAETDVLSRFTNLDLDPFAEDLLSLPLPFPVHTLYGDHVSTVVGLGLKAHYREGSIYLNVPPPTLAERLALLASRGILGNDLFHEVFHGLQDGIEQYVSLEEVLDALAGNEDLARVAVAEAHAWMCCLPGFKHDVLTDVISLSYCVTDRAMLTAAFELLYSLDTLGLRDEELGRLVGKSSWCAKSGTYLELNSELEQMLRTKGMSETDLRAETDRRMLIDRIQGVRAVGISRELVQALSSTSPAVQEVEVA